MKVVEAVKIFMNPSQSTLVSYDLVVASIAELMEGLKSGNVDINSFRADVDALYNCNMLNVDASFEGKNVSLAGVVKTCGSAEFIDVLTEFGAH